MPVNAKMIWFNRIFLLRYENTKLISKNSRQFSRATSKIPVQAVESKMIQYQSEDEKLGVTLAQFHSRTD